jgi:hypothetical protein
MAATTQGPAAAPADPEEYQQHIDNIFSLKRPRDIRAGLASGGKSALKGIAAGTVGLFAAPVVGAYTDGFKGFGQGVCAGTGHVTLCLECQQPSCKTSAACLAAVSSSLQHAQCKLS